MTSEITIEQYDAEEADAMSAVSYAEIMAFSTSTLNLHAFPARVAREAELARYVDWNNSSSNSQYFYRNYFVKGPSVETSFTSAEADIVEFVSDYTAKLTRDRYGREMRPASTLLSQFGLFRAVMAIQKDFDRPLAIFEVGPGNGYLGAMLLQAGLNYIGMDNSQALYLWQNRLLSECAGSDFFEWVSNGLPPATTPPRAQHLPWWRYLDLRHDCPIKADIFISNTNLGEMNYGALQYTTRISKKILEGSPCPAFLFTNIGDPKQNSIQTVEAEFLSAGYRKLKGDMMYIHVPNDSPASRTVASLGKNIPLFNPEDTNQRYSAHEILKITDDNLPMDMDFLEYVGTFTIPR